MEKKKTQCEKKTKNSNSKIKEYIKSFLLFIDKNIWKSLRILMVIAILLIAITLKPSIDYINTLECEGGCLDNATLWSDYISNAKLLLFTLIAGIVPYVYIPVIGFVSYIIQEVFGIATIIKELGYLNGIAAGIVPFILNLIVICIVTSLAIYLCRSTTIAYKITNIKNMNFTNFRIKFYEALQKKEKVQALVNKKEEKLKSLEVKKEKINYLQILNTIVVAGALLFIAEAIQHILI